MMRSDDHSTLVKLPDSLEYSSEPMESTGSWNCAIIKEVEADRNCGDGGLLVTRKGGPSLDPPGVPF